MAYCKACRKRHRGWSCPTCGADSKLFILLTVFLPAFAVTALVLLLLPRECAPCVVELPSGATRYALASHHMALVLPLLFGTGGLCLVLVSLRSYSRRAQVHRRQRWRASGPVAKGASVAWSGCLLLFVVGAVVVAIWLPQKLFRAVDVEGDEVVLRGAYAPRRLDRSDIVRAEVNREESTGSSGEAIVLLSIDLEDDRGHVYRSTYTGYPEDSAGYLALEEVLVALADRLSE